MESKREEIAKKLDKFAFNVKNIDRVIAFMVALFLVFALVVYTKKHKEYIVQEETYNRMLAEIEAHQLNVIYTNVKPSSGKIDGSKQKENPMFTNGVDATAYAFGQLYNAKTYETNGMLVWLDSINNSIEGHTKEVDNWYDLSKNGNYPMSNFLLSNFSCDKIINFSLGFIFNNI